MHLCMRKINSLYPDRFLISFPFLLFSHKSLNVQTFKRTPECSFTLIHFYVNLQIIYFKQNL